jgi:CubicO group peptidase (beta-lactamase class C family)
MIQSSVQDHMQQVLHAVVHDGRERGVQLAAYVNGKLVVEAWAGVTDASTNHPVTGDTLFPIFSVTKGIAATIIHILAQRGLLDYDTPIAAWWPEFASHGKGAITLRHALAHTAGLPNMPLGMGYSQLCDWDVMCAAIADLTPIHPPGARTIYHAITYSWLVGEVARRADGRPFGQLIQDEICRPLGLTDMFVGIPDEVEPRVATLDEIFETPLEPTPAVETVPSPVPRWIQPLHEMMNRPDARRACVPASNGIMTARAIARHYATLLPGGVNGVELLPPSRIEQATTWQKPTAPIEGDTANRFGLGYLLTDDGTAPPHSVPFGHNGYGGSAGFADSRTRLAVGFTKNLFSKNDSQGYILRELRRMLGT